MGRRRVIGGEGLPGHGDQPIPTAVRIDRFVFSSALSGQDPATHRVPEDPEAQVALAFDNLRRVIEAAGGGVGDIGKLTVYLKDMQHREIVNRHWTAMFPDPADRPVRHTVRAELRGATAIQLEFIAVL
jgi:2-iminobutanoate/2-iminopropanoate deaminase